MTDIDRSRSWLHAFLAIGLVALAVAGVPRVAAAPTPARIRPMPPLEISGAIRDERGSVSVRDDPERWQRWTPAATATPKPKPRATPQPKILATPAPKPIVSVRWMWPVRGWITTWFSLAHLATDIAAPCGTIVHAAHAGVVQWAGWKLNGGGLVVDVGFVGGLTSYNHLSATSVLPGQAVTVGIPIGRVGSTGNSTGCHLHFAVLLGGFWIDPLTVLP